MATQSSPPTLRQARPCVQTVTDLIRGSGEKDLVDVSVDTDDDGDSHPVTATDGHPFYVPGDGWVDAADLQPGNHLLEPTGNPATITQLLPRRLTTHVYNLTVSGPHTYYIQVDESSILVHDAKRKCRKKGGGGKEHTKNKRKSTKGKHEKGQARKKQRDNDKKRRHRDWRDHG